MKRKGPILLQRKVSAQIGAATNPQLAMKYLNDMLNLLIDTRFEACLAAVTIFAEKQQQISWAIRQNPKVSKNEVMELVVAAVIKHEKQMLQKFEKENKAKALQFLATSSYIPEKTRDNAKAALQKIKLQKLHAALQERHGPKARTKKTATPLTKAATLPKTKVETPLLAKQVYKPEKLKRFLERLGSPLKYERVSAAIEFIQRYACITPAIAKDPDVTVTKVTNAAVEVIQEAPSLVFDVMKKRKMLPELIFLAALSQIPRAIRQEAEKIAKELKAEETPMEIVAAHPIKVEKAKKGYTFAEIEVMVVALDSSNRKTAVKAALEFIRNYDDIIDTISKKPMLAVTEVTNKAVKTLRQNLDYVMDVLEKKKDRISLEFLAHSAKIPEDIRSRAGKTLERLFGKPQKKQDPAPKSKHFAHFKDKL